MVPETLSSKVGLRKQALSQLQLASHIKAIVLVPMSYLLVRFTA
jgi:hypothetical protein